MGVSTRRCKYYGYDHCTHQSDLILGKIIEMAYSLPAGNSAYLLTFISTGLGWGLSDIRMKKMAL